LAARRNHRLWAGGGGGTSLPVTGTAIDPALKKRALGVAFFTLFLDLLGFGIIIPVQPFYAEGFGASPTTVTWIGAAYSLMQFLFAPLWGALSDRIGRRPVVLMSVAFGAAGFLVFGLATSLWMLFLARMVAGFGNANLGTVQALVADVTPPEERARSMGLIGAAFGLGFVLGPAIGGIVGSQLGPHAPAFTAAGLGVLNLVLAAALLPETRRPGGKREGRGVFALAALSRVKAVPNVPQLLLIMFVFTTGFSLMETALSLFIEHRWVPRELIGTAPGQKQATALTTWVLLAVGVTAVIVQGGLIGRLRALFGEKRLIVVGCALIALSLAGIAAVPVWDAPYGAMFPLIVVLSVGSGVFSPSQSSLLSRSVDADHQGEVLGVSQSMGALGRIAGPAVSGWLFERSLGLPFVAGAALVGACVLVGLTLRETSK
jgi:multidrug resistance protein